MATIKSFTDLSQSKKLAEILPLESADMYYWCADHYPKEDWIIEVGSPDENYECICAWSLAALLKIIGHYTLQTVSKDKKVFIVSEENYPICSDSYSEPIDACVAMVEELHELKML